MFRTLGRWVRWSGGRLVYAGRATKAPFDAWAESPRGREAVARRAAGLRFALGGRAHAARRALWRELKHVAGDSRIAADIQREADAYLTRLGTLAYGDGLPRVSVELHRLVVVPVVLLNGAAYRGLSTRLAAHSSFRSMEGGDELRELLLLTVIADMESAVAGIEPTPKRPLEAGKSWTSVGLNRTFVWRVPFEAPDWAGHHYVFELTREPITRTTRKSIEEKMRAVAASLGSLSKSERADILRRATIAA